MSRQNKALLLAIAKVNNNLILAQKSKQQHQRYFSQLAANHPAFLLGVLLPPFIAGWQSGKNERAGNILQQAAKFGFATAFKWLRTYSLGFV